MRLIFAAVAATAISAAGFTAPAAAQNNAVEIAPPPPPAAPEPKAQAPDETEETAPPSPPPASIAEPEPAEPAAPPATPPMTTEVLPVSPDAPYPEGFADPVDPYADENYAYGAEDDGFDWGLLGLLGLLGLFGLRRGDRYARTVYTERGDRIQP